MGDVLPIRSADLPEPPDHLSTDAAARWRAVVEGWVIGPDGLPLLQAALEQWDQYRAASDILRRDGPTVVNPDSGVVRQHPAATVARDSLKAFRLCWKQLGLDPTSEEIQT